MEEDILRHCIELACASGRKFQSQESGFLSLPLSPNSLELGIPIYENMLFCLALFRSKTHESIFEAKKILDRLLFFQQPFASVESSGNFPLFIHDFPYCREHLQAVRCLTVLIWIYRGFHHILGQELLSRLTDSLHKLVAFCIKSVLPLSLPVWAKLKTVCVIAAFAELVQEPALLEKIEGHIPDLTDQSELRSWGDPIFLAEMISAYQLETSVIDPKQWESFWSYITATWHRESLSYSGPAYRYKQTETNFYDYCLGLFSGQLSQKANVAQAAALSCALLQRPSQLSILTFPFTKRGSNGTLFWGVHQLPSRAISYIEGLSKREEMHAFYPLYLTSAIHSLAIQAPQGFVSSFIGDAASQTVVIDLPVEVFVEEKEKNYPLYLWFDDHKETDILVSGKKASCFTLTDDLTIKLGACHVALSFEVIEGDGQFIGHITRGCRTGLRLKDKEKMVAPDIQVSLRAIRGTTACRIRLNILEN